jgi:hypothetical protein
MPLIYLQNYDAQTGGLLLYRVSSVPRKYQKSPLSTFEQATLLINRGLICDDRKRLESYLASIGYYRLSTYWFP